MSDATPPPPPGGSTPPRPPSPPPPPPPPGLTAPAPSPPPGYVAYGTQPTPSTPLRRIRGLSTAIVVVISIAGLAAVVSATLTPGAADDATAYLEGRLSEDDFLSTYGPVAAAQLVLGVATIAAGILTIVWMFRIASNLRAFQRRTFWAPLWAIFGWFLPPLVLYIIPFLMLRELWKVSTPDGPESSRENVTLWVWFLAFGIGPAILAGIQVSSIVGGGLGSGSTDDLADQLEESVASSVASGVLTVIAAIAWIVFVRQLTRRHVVLTSER